MITCARAVRLVSEREDRRVGFVERLKLGLHLVLCSICRRYGRQVHRLRRFSIGNREALAESLEASLSRDARERIRTRLREASGG